MSQSIGGHTMRVTLDRDTVCLIPECHEPDGAQCRVVCPEGCEQYEYPEHEHGLERIKFCNAVEWLTSEGDVVGCCGKATEFPLYDGMTIAVNWEGDYYSWSPEND